MLKLQRDGGVGPGVIELVAAIAADNGLNAQSVRGLGEGARLVAQLAG